VGYQVFGDTYPRGAFLARLAGELRSAGVPRGEDLPDFLPTVLRLLGRVGAADAAPLLEVVVLPALARMNQALDDSRSPWSDVIRALPAVLGEPAGHEVARDPAAGTVAPRAAEARHA
jgi:nitrate reductase delta subunit